MKTEQATSSAQNKPNSNKPKSPSRNGGGPQKSRRPRNHGKQGTSSDEGASANKEKGTPSAKPDNSRQGNKAETPSKASSKKGAAPKVNEPKSAVVDDKFSGSSFHQSPNAASLPRPPFVKPPSPPQQQQRIQPAPSTQQAPPNVSYQAPFFHQHPYMMPYPPHQVHYPTLGAMPLHYPPNYYMPPPTHHPMANPPPASVPMNVQHR